MPPSSNQVSDVGFVAPTDYAIEAQDIERRRRMAEALRQQGQPPLGGTEVIGGWAIPKSPMEGLSRALQQGVGSYQEKQLGERQRELAAAMRTDRQRTVEEAMGAMQGSAAVAQPPDEIGGGPGREAIPGDPRRAYGILAGSQDPQLQQMGLANMLKQPTLKNVDLGDRIEVRDEAGRLVQTLPKGATPDATMTDSRTRSKVEIAPSGVAYNPFQTQAGAVFNDPNKLIGIGADGQPVVNQPLVGVKKDIARSGATNVNVDARERQRTFENENKLRDDYVTASKPFVGIRDAYNTVKAALAGPTTAASTLAGATKFMKMIDPESVVRESELNMALKTSGVLDRFMNIHNTIMQGQVLTPTQKRDMIKITQTLYDAAEKQQKKTDDYFSGLAKQYQLEPGRVIRNQGAVAAQTPGGAPKKPAPQGVDPRTWAAMTPEEQALWP